jgi:hypothetical protein
MKHVNVIPNPYSAVAPDGVPQGVYPLPGAPGRWIGAAFDDKASAAVNGKARFRFSLDKSSVPLTGEVARAVRSGELIAGDEACADACGVKFATLDKMLAHCKQVAASAFAGELADIPMIETEAKAEKPEATGKK